MDRTVYIGAIVQVNNGLYDPCMSFIPDIMDRMVHIGAVFQNLDRKNLILKWSRKSNVFQMAILV